MFFSFFFCVFRAPIKRKLSESSDDFAAKKKALEMVNVWSNSAWANLCKKATEFAELSGKMKEM